MINATSAAAIIGRLGTRSYILPQAGFAGSPKGIAREHNALREPFAVSGAHLSSATPKAAAGAVPRGPNDPGTEYRVVSVQRSTAPAGSAGSDWHVYRIAQGSNMIHGYRRGNLASVTADAEKIVSGLNERRNFRRGRVDLRPGRRPANAEPKSEE